METKILKRIIAKSKIPDFMEALVDRLSLTDLQSLLLEVYRKRTAKLRPANLLKSYNTNRFVQSSPVEPKKFLEFDSLAFKILPDDFEGLELSPVSPLGNNSIIAPVDQNNIITTIRNSEVCADSTNLLALECARRRKIELSKNTRSKQQIKLSASHRLIRGQLFDEPTAFPHFRVFSLCTAGSDEGFFRFEFRSLLEHVNFYLDLSKAAEKIGYKYKNIQVNITPFNQNIKEKFEAEIFNPISERHPEVELNFDKDKSNKINYYSTCRFQIHIRDKQDQNYLIVDGGFTDWTQQLLSNKKERLLISGFGTERFILVFG